MLLLEQIDRISRFKGDEQRSAKNFDVIDEIESFFIRPSSHVSPIKHLMKEIQNYLFNKLIQDTMERQQQQANDFRQGRRPNLKDLFRSPNMRMKTLIISFSW